MTSHGGSARFLLHFSIKKKLTKETYISCGLETGLGLKWCWGSAGEADTCRETLLLKDA